MLGYLPQGTITDKVGGGVSRGALHGQKRVHALHVGVGGNGSFSV